MRSYLIIFIGAVFLFVQPAMSTDGTGKDSEQKSNFKVSGYFQPQFRSHSGDSIASSETGRFSGGLFPDNVTNHVQLRRGRVKGVFTKGLTQAVIQIDATPGRVIPVDVYGIIVDTWTESIGLQVGLFNRPFGYEVELSSGRRESPERSRLFQTLFPGDRDLGAKLFYSSPDKSSILYNAEVGLFNGTGRSNEEFDSYKDIITQFGVGVPVCDGVSLGVGISGYFGKVRNSSPIVFSSRGASFVRDSSATNIGRGLERTYYGVDGRLEVEIPTLGMLSLRGEVILGKQPGTDRSTISPTSQPSGPLYQRDFMGWYAILVQNLGPDNQIVAKYDVYDPNTDVAAVNFTGSNNATMADIKFSTLGLGIIHHWDARVKFVVYYEIVRNEELNQSITLAKYAGNINDDVFTLRMQVGF